MGKNLQNIKPCKNCKKHKEVNDNNLCNKCYEIFINKYNTINNLNTDKYYVIYILSVRSKDIEKKDYSYYFNYYFYNEEYDDNIFDRFLEENPKQKIYEVSPVIFLHPKNYLKNINITIDNLLIDRYVKEIGKITDDIVDKSINICKQNPEYYITSCMSYLIFKHFTKKN